MTVEPVDNITRFQNEFFRAGTFITRPRVTSDLVYDSNDFAVCAQTHADQTLVTASTKNGLLAYPNNPDGPAMILFNTATGEIMCQRYYQMGQQTIGLPDKPSHGASVSTSLLP